VPAAEMAGDSPSGGGRAGRLGVECDLSAWLKTMCCRQELLEGVPAADMEEMREAVADALEAVGGSGWQLIGVGGGARGVASHDCDFIVTHNSNK